MNRKCIVSRCYMNAKPGSFTCEKHTDGDEAADGVVPGPVHAAIGDPVVVTHPEIAALNARVDALLAQANALTKERDDLATRLASIVWSKEASELFAGKFQQWEYEYKARVARLESALREARDAFIKYEIDVDDAPPYAHRQMMERINAALGTNDATPKPNHGP